MGEVGRILRRRDFRSLLYTRVSGQFGDGLLQSALATFVLFSPQRQTSASAVAASFVVLYLPYSLIGPFAGVLLDRWRRRVVLVRANLLRALSVLPLLWLVASSRADVWLGIAVLITFGIGRFVLAGLSASLPHVVLPTQLMLANSFKPTAGTIAYALGALVGVGIRATAGGGDTGSLVVLAVTALVYLSAGLYPLQLNADALGPQEGPQHTAREVFGEFVEGAGQLRRQAAAGKSLAMVFVNRVLVGALTIMLLLVLRNRIHPVDDPDAALGDFAAIAGAVTVGALLAALLTPRFGRRLGPVQWTCLVAVIAGCALTPTLFSLAVLPIIVVSPLVGLSNQSAKICSDSIIQRRIADEALGRVFAIVDLTVNMGLVIGVCLVAFLFPEDGVTAVGFMLIGLTYLAAALAYFATRDVSLDKDPVFGERPAALPQ